MADLAAYLDRIELQDSPTLATIHRAHATSIPFENLAPWSGQPVSLNLGDVERKLLAASAFHLENGAVRTCRVSRGCDSGDLSCMRQGLTKLRHAAGECLPLGSSVSAGADGTARELVDRGQA
jgi:hypothetical protein